jgi:hypothetical protein
VGQQPCRDDRSAGSQVLVDLQRRVRADAAGGHEHVGGVEKQWNLFGVTLPGKDHGGAEPRAFGTGAAGHDLLGTSAREHESRVGPLVDYVLCRREQQVEPLVRLEGSGVEHNPGIERKAEPLADART